jgi:hypothetical protein
MAARDYNLARKTLLEISNRDSNQRAPFRRESQLLTSPELSKKQLGESGAKG